MAATETILLKLTPEELAALNDLCGEQPRATWVKGLIQAAVAARRRFGGPCGLGVVACEEFPAGHVGVNDRNPDFQQAEPLSSGYEDQAAPDAGAGTPPADG